MQVMEPQTCHGRQIRFSTLQVRKGYTENLKLPNLASFRVEFRL